MCDKWKAALWTSVVKMSQLLLLCMDVHECKYTCTNIKCIIILNIFILNIQKLIGILNWKRMWRKKRCQIVSMNAPYVYTFLFLKEIDMQNRIKTIIRVPFKYNLVFLNGVIVYFHPWLILTYFTLFATYYALLSYTLHEKYFSDSNGARFKNSY